MHYMHIFKCMSSNFKMLKQKAFRNKNSNMGNTAVILENLRTIRKSKEIKQSVIAHELGCDSASYSRKERGQIPITTEEWVKIAAILNEPVASFFKGGDIDVSKTPGAYSREEDIYTSRVVRILRSGNRTAISGIKSIVDTLFKSLSPDYFVQAVQTGKSKRNKSRVEKAAKKIHSYRS